MAAVLEKTGVWDEKEVWAWAADEEDCPKIRLSDEELDRIGISERDYSKMSLLERSAYRLRLKGHDVWVADESDDEFDASKYLDEKVLKYLNAMKLDKNWSGQG